MTQEELEQLLADLEAAHREASIAILTARANLENFDDFTTEALDRRTQGLELALGRVQLLTDRLPNRRHRVPPDDRTRPG